MQDEKLKLSRRSAIVAFSAVSGALAVPVAEGVAAAAEPEVTPRDLVAPLKEGTKFGRWQLESIGPIDQGAVEVVVTGATGRFRIEILAREDSALMPRGPARTEHFAVHVVNDGNGSSRTEEDHGLCAMTLATFIAKNESRAAARSFATLAHRLDLESRGQLRRP